MTEKDLAERLFKFANDVARRGGVKIGAGARSLLFDYAQKAARDIALLETRNSSKSPGSNAEIDDRFASSRMISHAERAFESVINRMIEARQQIYGEMRNEIGERTLEVALKSLCPIWPFCDKAMK